MLRAALEEDHLLREQLRNLLDAGGGLKCSGELAQPYTTGGT